jgi:hypothetical protein
MIQAINGTMHTLDSWHSKCFCLGHRSDAAFDNRSAGPNHLKPFQRADRRSITVGTEEPRKAGFTIQRSVGDDSVAPDAWSRWVSTPKVLH